MAGEVWLGVCGWGSVAGSVWLCVCSWVCVAGGVWLGECGWECVVVCVWLGACGWVCVAGGMWLGGRGWGGAWLGVCGLHLVVHQQLRPLEVPRGHPHIVLLARVVELGQSPVNQSQLKQKTQQKISWPRPH